MSMNQQPKLYEYVLVDSEYLRQDTEGWVFARNLQEATDIAYAKCAAWLRQESILELDEMLQNRFVSVREYGLATPVHYEPNKL